jgi:TolB-like protein/DNA-binding winged helix-turn-helix (wHTH) protein/Tfp pilus assembly protein PilF
MQIGAKISKTAAGSPMQKIAPDQPQRDAPHAERYRLGAADVWVAERVLLVDGKRVELGGRGFEVLLALIENRHRVVSKDELLQIAWPGLVVEENNLQQQISTLRKLLGQQAIATVPGHGYRFMLEERETAAGSGASTPAPVLADRPGRASPGLENGRPTPWRGRRAAGVATAIALSGAVGAWWYLSHPAVKPEQAAGLPTPGPMSVAVLPFANLTGDPNQGYLADGMTAALAGDLTRIRDAYIVDASRSYAFKDKPVLPQQAGAQLGVHYVLVGSVQRDKDKIRVHAQLDDTGSNAQLWSETFDGEESDLFAMQDHVTTRIVNAINRAMFVAAARESEKRKSSPQAADILLRAWALTVTPYTAQRATRAEELYRQALAIEPNNAVAMVGLANAIASRTNDFDFDLDDKTREKRFAESRDWALKAKELDPEIPGIYVTLGIYANNHNDFPGQMRAAETRLALEPKNPVSYFNLAGAYLAGADPQRAIALMRQGIDLDPKGVREVTTQMMGWAYFMQGDNDAAIEWSLHALEKNPKFVYSYAVLAMAYALKGDRMKASAAAAEVRRLEPGLKMQPSDRPQSSFPDAAREFFDKRNLPAWRKAGLPEAPGLR